MKPRHPFVGDPWARQVQRYHTTQRRTDRLAAAREDMGHALDSAHRVVEIANRMGWQIERGPGVETFGLHRGLKRAR